MRTGRFILKRPQVLRPKKHFAKAQVAKSTPIIKEVEAVETPVIDEVKEEVQEESVSIKKVNKIKKNSKKNGYEGEDSNGSGDIE